jgi:hypothetical protein
MQTSNAGARQDLLPQEISIHRRSPSQEISMHRKFLVSLHGQIFPKKMQVAKIIKKSAPANLERKICPCKFRRRM